MQYDIALKTLLECAREDFFREILQENVREVKGIEELPQETVSVRSTDFPVRVFDEDGRELIHLIEFQTDWKREKLWSMLQYKARYTEKYHLPVRSTMVLLRKSDIAVDFLEEEELHFKFRLVKMWELPAGKFLAQQCLLPMVPLMDGGLELIREVEEKIYSSDDAHKIDNLTIFSILTGLRDKELSLELVKRRRDIMIESPVYDMILEEGIQKGILEGKLEGELHSKLETARKLLEDGFPIEKILQYTELTRTALKQAGIIEE